jgi:hypothetical protein
LAPRALLGKLSKVSLSGSKRTMALAVKSVSQTLSRSSTHTEYVHVAEAPGSFQAFQDFWQGRTLLTLPLCHSLTQRRPLAVAPDAPRSLIRRRRVDGRRLATRQVDACDMAASERRVVDLA